MFRLFTPGQKQLSATALGGFYLPEPTHQWQFAPGFTTILCHSAALFSESPEFPRRQFRGGGELEDGPVSVNLERRRNTR